MDSTRSRPVLLVGLPRSGTTWMADLLTRPRHLAQIYEPDNEKNDPLAWYAKRSLHRFPYLAGDDRVPEFEAFWRFVFSGQWPRTSLLYRGLQQWFRRVWGPALEAHIGEKTGLVYVDEIWNRVRRGRAAYREEDHRLTAHLVARYLSTRSEGPSGSPLLVKSVHLPLALEWIANRFDVRIVVLLRNPFGLHASYLRERYPDGCRNVLTQTPLRERLGRLGVDPASVPLRRPDDHVGLQSLVMYRLLATQIGEHPDWIVASHDRLCADPGRELGRILGRLPEPWSRTPPEAFLDPPPDPARLARQPVKWKQELSEEDYRTTLRLIDAFGLGPFLSDHVYSEAFDYAR